MREALKRMNRELALRKLHEFVRQSWSIVEPGMPFIDNWHIGAICDHLEAVERGDIRNLLINIPPGHAKSLLVSVFWPAWMWARRPAWRGLFGSYAEQLAVRDSVRCRMLVSHPWYKKNFSQPAEWKLVWDQNTKGFFKNTATGERMSVSVGSRATGFRGNAVVIDDPLNATEVQSLAALERAIYWYDKAMSTRLNDPRVDVKIVIMQRLHELDLSGHLITSGTYEHLCLPSEFEPKRKTYTFIQKKTCSCPRVARRIRYIDDDGDEKEMEVLQECACERVRTPFWEDPRTKPNELLFPELFPQKVLDELKTPHMLGASGFAGQHQQRPAPEEGERFKKVWWRFFRHEGDPEVGVRPDGCYKGAARTLPKLDQIILSLDATFKKGLKTDYVVFQIWGTQKADRYLLDQSRARRTFTETLTEMRRLVAKWPMAKRKIVEDKANGPAIIDALQREMSGIVPVEPEGGKEARAAAAQPEVESGNVFLCDGAPWLEEFVEEFAAFPNGAHDDQVDAYSQAMKELAGSSAITRLRELAQK